MSVWNQQKVLLNPSVYPAAGNIGDGKIFVSDVEESHTIRTGEKIKGTG